MRQDAGQAHAGHGQAGLGEAHGQQGSRLALTEAGEAGGEGGKAPCRRSRGDACQGLGRLGQESQATHPPARLSRTHPDAQPELVLAGEPLA